MASPVPSWDRLRAKGHRLFSVSPEIGMQKMRAPLSIQQSTWHLGLRAVKDSLNFASYKELYDHLVDSLPQNSPVVRKRRAGLVVRRSFPDKDVKGLLSRAWDAHKDESVLSDLMRVTTLEAEPIVAAFTDQYVLTRPPGDILAQDLVRDYIVSTFGVYRKDYYGCLLQIVRDAGFVTRLGGQWIINGLPRPSNAVVILLHSRLAPTPRIVRLSDILVPPQSANGDSTYASIPFWRLLGMREEAEVCAILRDAESAGLIAKYAIVDQLEQVTTRYSLDEYLAGGYRL